MHMQQNNIGARGTAISKAISIIESGLQQALNKDAGGEIAERLDALYTYMTRRLLEANLKQDETMLVEIDNLLATLEDAWVGIGPEVAQMTAAPV
jgi:flagellar protein FliS